MFAWLKCVHRVVGKGIVNGCRRRGHRLGKAHEQIGMDWHCTGSQLRRDPAHKYFLGQDVRFAANNVNDTF